MPLLAAPADAQPAQPNDITGDGRGELAVGSPAATANGVANAGSVSVVFGSATGVDTTKDRLVTQSSPGVPGTPEKGDRFGAQVATGDLDGDGNADLIVSAPGEDVGAHPDAGLVQIVFGADSGPSGRAVSIEPPHRADDVTGFGSALAVGDFNDDGLSDLAAGGGGNTISILYGTPGLGGSGAPALKEITLDVSGIAALAAGEVDGADGADNYTDLVVSAPGWDGKDGLVRTFPGSADGLADTPWGGSVFQDEPPKRIGVGDVNGDGHAEVAILGATDYARPLLFRGSAQGFVQEDPITIGPDEELIKGGGLWIDDVNLDGYADVALGRPARTTDAGDYDDRGTAALYWGGADHIADDRVQTFAQGRGGVPGSAEYGDLFGATIAVNEFNGGTSRRDLVIAATGENGGNGAVTVLYGGKGTGDPVSTVGARTFGGATLGHAGTKAFGTGIAGLPRPS